jgi:hypothetical protein
MGANALRNGGKFDERVAYTMLEPAAAARSVQSCVAPLSGPGGADVTRLRGLAGLGRGDLTLADAHGDRLRERSFADDLVLDGDLPAGARSDDLDLADPRLQDVDRALDLGVMRGASLRYEPLEDRQRLGVALELVVRLADVVEHGPCGAISYAFLNSTSAA